jgi:hypothetical protein
MTNCKFHNAITNNQRRNFLCVLQKNYELFIVRSESFLEPIFYFILNFVMLCQSSINILNQIW